MHSSNSNSVNKFEFIMDCHINCYSTAAISLIHYNIIDFVFNKKIFCLQKLFLINLNIRFM